MHRSMLALACLLVACVPDPQSELELAAMSQEVSVTNITREHITGDIYHYGFVVRVGDGPNAKLHIHRVVRERSPWVPRRATDAVMMLHGDFATFPTNFAPSASGIAPWLAERNIDVWGVDRRWTQAPELDPDLSDFDAMDLEQELDDTRKALAFARGIRLVTDASLDRMTLVGFSRGGQLAYFYASREATRPPALRHVKGIVPLDVYVSPPPEAVAERDFFCETAAFEYELLAEGFVDSPNSFQIETGRLALSAPDDPTPSPFFPGRTNRQVLLIFTGRSHIFFPATPVYHLNAPIIDGVVTGLRESSETVVATWLANAPPYASMRESADTDGISCGNSPLVAEYPLSRIQVPLLLIAAAGGYGHLAPFNTTQVGSTDVTTLVIQQMPDERVAEDFGHADLLFSPNAATLAWQPLLSWLQQH